MGQYIAKTYMETKKRPHYIISDTNKEDAEKTRIKIHGILEGLGNIMKKENQD